MNIGLKRVTGQYLIPQRLNVYHSLAMYTFFNATIEATNDVAIGPIAHMNDRAHNARPHADWHGQGENNAHDLTKSDRCGPMPPVAMAQHFSTETARDGRARFADMHPHPPATSPFITHTHDITNSNIPFDRLPIYAPSLTAPPSRIAP
jgi:hypothetical protein